VYLDESGPSPLYTIEMKPTFKVTVENRKKTDKDSVTMSPSGNGNTISPFYETILLKNEKKKLIFQFTVDVKEEDDFGRKLLAAIQNACHPRDNPKKSHTGVIYAEVVEQKLEKKDVNL